MPSMVPSAPLNLGVSEAVGLGAGLDDSPAKVSRSMIAAQSLGSGNVLVQPEKAWFDATNVERGRRIASNSDYA